MKVNLAKASEMSNTAYLSTGAILTGIEIYEQVQSGKIIIDPFTIDRLNPNSYNLRLSNKLKVYDWGKFDKPYIDSHVKNNPIKEIEIPEDGLVLYPNKLYIGSTIERTATDHFIPVLDGRSSGGRMGLLVHVCAGYGDIGFDGTWTLEIVVIEPLRIYPGDEVAQVTFFTPFGYTGYKYRGRYYGQSDPTESKFAEDKKEESMAKKAIEEYKMYRILTDLYRVKGSMWFQSRGYIYEADCSFELYDGETLSGDNIIKDNKSIGHAVDAMVREYNAKSKTAKASVVTIYIRRPYNIGGDTND